MPTWTISLVVLLGNDIGDVVPWMAVESLLESLLVHVMTNESYAATQHKQRVDGAHIDVLLCLLAVKIQNKLTTHLTLLELSLLPSEGAAVAQHIDESGGNDTIHIQNQIWLLAGGDPLHLQGILQQRTLWEVLHDELLDDLDTHIGIVDRLDTMANAQNELAVLTHLVDKLHGMQVGVVGLRELSGRAIQRTSKTIALQANQEHIRLYLIYD